MASSVQDKTVPAKMEFKLKEDEKFTDWLLRVKPRLEFLAGIVGRKNREDKQPGSAQMLIENLDALLEDLSDIALEVKEHTIRAKEYYQDWVAESTAAQMKVNGGWTDAKKTAQDFAVKLNCSEKRIHDRLEAMNATIEYRTTSAQSMLRSLKP